MHDMTPLQIENRKLNWNAQSKIKSLENHSHRPGGGDKKIENRRLEWNVESKVGSTKNITHKAGGGRIKVGRNCSTELAQYWKLTIFIADPQREAGVQSDESHWVPGQREAQARGRGQEDLRRQGVRAADDERAEQRDQVRTNLTGWLQHGLTHSGDTILPSLSSKQV